MPGFSTTARIERTLRSMLLRWFVALWLACPGLALAETALYQAAVPLGGAAAADKAAGFGEALRTAAVRASGQRDAASNAVIAAAAAEPSRYVQQYAMTADRTLKVGFDGRGMEDLLQKAGLPLWPAERPTTLVALFLPAIAGGTRAVLATERPPERTEIEKAALYRGVPIVWPQQPLSPAAARARPADDIARAVLAGEGSGSALSWTFTHSGQARRGQGGPAAGVDLAADTLAAFYAPPSTRGLSTVSVRIGGVANVGAYASLLEYLKSLSLVRGAVVEEASGDRVQLRLALRGDVELLRRIAALDTHLVAGTGPAEGGSGATDFTWQP
jgi:hypothetical protein